MANFDRVRHDRHMRFEESICELTPLFALHRLSGEFHHRPPSGVRGARDHAPRFEAHTGRVEGRVQPVPRAGLPVWLSDDIRRPEESSLDRDLNRVVAVALPDDFLADRPLRRDCGWLDRRNAKADRTLADHTDSWTNFPRGRGGVARTPQPVKTPLSAAGKGRRRLAGDAWEGRRVREGAEVS